MLIKLNISLKFTCNVEELYSNICIISLLLKKAFEFSDEQILSNTAYVSAYLYRDNKTKNKEAALLIFLHTSQIRRSEANLFSSSSTSLDSELRVIKLTVKSSFFLHCNFND